MNGFRLIPLALAFTAFINSSHYVFADDNPAFSNLDGMLVVVNKSDNSVSLIDIAAKKIINTMPTGKGPHELIVSDNGKIAISTDFVGGDSLTVFDLVEQKIIRTIDLEKYPGPHGIRFLQDQRRVAFTSGKSQHLVIVNINTGEVEHAINTEQKTTHMVAISYPDKLAYTTNIRSNSISKVSLSDFRLLKQISTEDDPEAINVTQDGKQLWYGANKEGLVTVIDTQSEKQLAQFTDFDFPYRILFSHDEKVAIVPDFRKHEVRFFDVATLTELGRLTLEEGAGPQGITLHSQHDIVFLSLNLKNKIVAIDIASRQIIAQYPTGNNPDGVGYIPNH